jgi:hypothetical protein
MLQVALSLIESCSNFDLWQLKIEQTSWRTVCMLALQLKDLNFDMRIFIIEENFFIIICLFSNDHLRWEML